MMSKKILFFLCLVLIASRSFCVAPSANNLNSLLEPFSDFWDRAPAENRILFKLDCQRLVYFENKEKFPLHCLRFFSRYTELCPQMKFDEIVQQILEKMVYQ